MKNQILFAACSAIGPAPARGAPGLPTLGLPTREAQIGTQIASSRRLDLWSRNLDTGDARQLTQFDRDTYDPSVTSRGDVLFKVQIFSAVVGVAPAARHVF